MTSYLYRRIVFAFSFVILTFFNAGAFLTDLPIKEIAGRQCYYYEVNEGDDIFSIADQLGLSRADIVDYNSAVADGVRPGMKLYFPVDVFGTRETFEPVLKLHPVVLPVSIIDATVDTIGLPDEPVSEVMPPRVLSVAVCLPFELADENISNNAIHATNFYRGFLLGVDSLRAYYGNPMLNIVAIDCGKDNSPFNPESDEVSGSLSEVDIIIAPQNSGKMNSLAKFGSKNNKYVFNVFNAHDTTYYKNRYMIQGNIPTTPMYKKAIDWFMDNLDGAVPVILESEKGKKDKQQFTDRLKKRLASEGIEVLTVKYDKTLTPSDLDSKLPKTAKAFVFIPTSSANAEFSKFAPALIEYKNGTNKTNANNAKVRLFGYPEFTVFSGDSADKLAKIGTDYYTRFYSNTSTQDAQQLQDSYIDRFALKLPGGVPNQVMYGFDIAKWILSFAAENSVTPEAIQNTDVVDGLQMSYRFKKLANGGFYNDVLLMVSIDADSEPKVEALR